MKSIKSNFAREHDIFKMIASRLGEYHDLEAAISKTITTYLILLLCLKQTVITLVVWTNCSQVNGSSSGKTHSVDSLISCSTASILNSTKSFTLSINSSRSPGGKWEGHRDRQMRGKERASIAGRVGDERWKRDNGKTYSMWVDFAYPKPCRCGRGTCLYSVKSSWWRSIPAV